MTRDIELEKINNEIIKLSNEMELSESISNVLQTLARIETKVEIHNNYEKRIGILEKNQYKFMGALFLVSIVIPFVLNYLIKQI